MAMMLRFPKAIGSGPIRAALKGLSTMAGSKTLDTKIRVNLLTPDSDSITSEKARDIHTSFNTQLLSRSVNINTVLGVVPRGFPTYVREMRQTRDPTACLQANVRIDVGGTIVSLRGADRMMNTVRDSLKEALYDNLEMLMDMGLLLVVRYRSSELNERQDFFFDVTSNGTQKSI